MRKDPLRYRSADLVAAILGAVYTADTAGDDPYRWTELVEEHVDPKHNARTIDNVIRELVAFGALHKIGTVGRGTDTRAVVPTLLGRAWLDQELLPLHGAETTA